ncbi:MAG: metallophosphoesterase, partial [Proteobacteria bacterium]
MSLTRLLTMLAIVGVVLGGTHWYLVVRLVRDTQLPEGATRAGKVLIAALAVLVLAGFAAARSSNRAAVVVLTNSSYVWLGLFFFLFVGLLAADLARLLWWVGSRLSGPVVDDPDRRRFFARAVALAAGGTAVAAGVFGATQALGEVAVKVVRVALPRL